MSEHSSLAVSNLPAIQVDNISIVYRVPHEPVSGIKEFAIRWLQRQLSYEAFYALKNVSFRVGRGETFGVIGRNGSGKSTLLKVIARVLFPPEGRVVLRGVVFPLLELGAGFHNELTGKENIYLNSALLGRSRREVDRLLDGIIDFAEVGDFIDSPLRTYSTGMIGRLGFAVATASRPDILLVDEVLSVGDAGFQQKCLDRMQSFRDQGTTVLIVSHSMTTIQAFCSKALWLNRGKVGALGSVDEVIDRYVEFSRLETANEVIQAPPELPEAVSQPPEPQETLSEEIVSNAELPVELPRESTPAKKPEITIRSYTSLASQPATYSAAGVFNPEKGSLTAWLAVNFEPNPAIGAIFHTDDSRFVFYITPLNAAELEPNSRLLVARAGGNRRVLNTYFGRAEFPEAGAAIEPKADSPVWRHVCMTWDGSPAGKLQIYLDGEPVNFFEYDGRYSNTQSPAQYFAIGYRPGEWVGEIIHQEDGSTVVTKVETSMRAAESGLILRDIRLYQNALSESEVAEIWAAGINEALPLTPLSKLPVN